MWCYDASFYFLLLNLLLELYYLNQMAVEQSPLRHAPHTATCVIQSEWSQAYSRETAVYPDPRQRARKYWPTVRRIDNVHGDKNLICTCDAWPDA